MHAGESTAQVKDARALLKEEAWFSSTSIAAAAAKRDIEATFQIKINHTMFPKQFIDNSSKDSLGSAHVALEGKYPGRVELVVIGHRCNSKVTSHFTIAKQDQLRKRPRTKRNLQILLAMLALD